ncbi:MAG TPA: SCP2 sterol-binding domain-containing protein [Anaerolineae bacterium]|nr:SCP2 sterol-binding domain-containing protein [Anaerolineae bacterium]
MPEFTSAAQALEALPALADPEKLAGLEASVLFDLSGEGGGQWTATIANSQLSIAEEAIAAPTMTLKMTAADFVAMVNGDLNAMAAFMQGRLKVEGDMSVAVRLQSLFG